MRNEKITDEEQWILFLIYHTHIVLVLILPLHFLVEDQENVLKVLVFVRFLLLFFMQRTKLLSSLTFSIEGIPKLRECDRFYSPLAYFNVTSCSKR